MACPPIQHHHQHPSAVSFDRSQQSLTHSSSSSTKKAGGQQDNSSRAALIYKIRPFFQKRRWFCGLALLIKHIGRQAPTTRHSFSFFVSGIISCHLPESSRLEDEIQNYQRLIAGAGEIAQITTMNSAHSAIGPFIKMLWSDANRSAHYYDDRPDNRD